ncbi:response regulator [Thalassotalea sp. M1531]|uniref:histidine kinase n=1 Tax=Thalassotalea algicola TaxID=2716224 RepID=A0A7Y0Q7N7_9GAMM|nr:response regulator [Thalassotalea algicola]NMP32102.1 response regulator [Thalassotalea algicola]
MTTIEANKGQVSVLFVDDERAILAAIKRLTRNIPARFYFSNSPIEALELIVKEKLDIIISDMRMPEMDGITFLSHVAENYPETIRIMLTGNAESDVVMSAINKGRIWSFIEKPWDPEQLILTIKQAIQTRNLMRSRVNHLYQELEQAKQLADSGSKEKSNFLAVMSHEIRTPMNAMLGSMELLSSTNLDEPQRALISNALTAGESLSTLVNDILDFSKIEAGKLQLKPAELNTIELVDYLHSLFIERVKEKGIGLMFCISPKLSAQLFLDDQRVKQILINLIANAIKFTLEGGVEISVYGNENLIHFEVKDTGIGIKNEDISKLFNKFVQADSSYKRQFEGTGLGLAITKQLVELMGGEVRVGSTEGKGSTFLVAIPHEYYSRPIIDSELARPKQLTCYNFSRYSEASLKKQLHLWGCEVNFVQEKSQPTKIVVYEEENNLATKQECVQFDRFWTDSYSALLSFVFGQGAPLNAELNLGEYTCIGAGEHILVVEDSLPNQLVIRTMLERVGYKVDIANNGKEAIKAVDDFDYQLVLMDLSMPVMDGAQACRIIRSKSDKFAKLPIWAMTANVTKDDMQHCFEAGMNEFIEKPINRDVLLFKIHEFFKLTRHNNVSECGDLNTSKSAVSNTYTKRVEEVEVLNHDVTNQLKIDVGDDIFIKVIDLFIKETDRRIVVIKQAALEDDIQQIEKEAHAIKSSASSVGAIALGDLARLLELSCQQNNAHELPELVAGVSKLAFSSLSSLKQKYLLDSA